MLTSFQAEVVAFATDGAIVCADCMESGDWDETLARKDGESWRKYVEYLADLDVQPLIRYEVESEFPEGLWCDSCADELVEPDEEYCIEHHDWAVEFNDDGEPVQCSLGEQGDCNFGGGQR
jgi:hypothetical protein